MRAGARRGAGSWSRSARSPPTPSTRADVFLPTLGVGREERHHAPTSRDACMRLARLITPEGTTMDDWRIAAGAGAAVRRRLRLRHRRGRAGRDRPRRARVRGRRRRARRPRARRRGAPDRRLPRRDRVPARARGHHRALVGADPARRRRRRVAPLDLGTGAVAASGTGADPIKPGLASGERRRKTGVGRGGGPDRHRGARGAPRLHVWDRAVTAPVPTPPDAYSLRLVAARTLYDAGRHRVVEPVARRRSRPAPRSSCTRATSDASA